jgi:cytolysin (calcineurin-like family phosphatase)
MFVALFALRSISRGVGMLGPDARDKKETKREIEYYRTRVQDYIQVTHHVNVTVRAMVKGKG